MFIFKPFRDEKLVLFHCFSFRKPVWATAYSLRWIFYCIIQRFRKIHDEISSSTCEKNSSNNLFLAKPSAIPACKEVIPLLFGNLVKAGST